MDGIDIAARLAGAIDGPLEIGETLVDLLDRTCVVVTVAGRRAVAKIDASTERAWRELAGLQAARSGGVAVPEVLVADGERPAALLLEWIEGRPMGDEPAEWGAVGAQLRRLHDLPIPHGMPAFDADSTSWREFLETWTRRESALCAEMRALGDDECRMMCDLLVDRLAGLPAPPRVLLHGDCQVGHVIVDEPSGAVTLIDFGDASTGDPLWDLVVLLLYHPQHEQDVLAGYDADHELRCRFEDWADVYRLVRFLGEITWLVEHGFTPSGSVAGARSAFERLSRSSG